MSVTDTWVRVGVSGHHLHAVVFFDPSMRRALTMCREDYRRVRDTGEPDSPFCSACEEKISERWMGLSILRDRRETSLVP